MINFYDCLGEKWYQSILLFYPNFVSNWQSKYVTKSKLCNVFKNFKKIVGLSLV